MIWLSLIFHPANLLCSINSSFIIPVLLTLPILLASAEQLLATFVTVLFALSQLCYSTFLSRVQHGLLTIALQQCLLILSVSQFCNRVMLTSAEYFVHFTMWITARFTTTPLVFSWYYSFYNNMSPSAEYCKLYWITHFTVLLFALPCLLAFIKQWRTVGLLYSSVSV